MQQNEIINPLKYIAIEYIDFLIVAQKVYIAILASFVNLLLPNRGFGEGWGGVKNLRLMQELL